MCRLPICSSHLAGFWPLDSDPSNRVPITQLLGLRDRPLPPLPTSEGAGCMLGAVVRVPAPILLPLLLPGPTRPLLLRRGRHCLPPEPPMASATPRDAAKPDAAPAPAPTPLPLPPEKPLPGDCCGSGCVRCVWDIYFDELDAYDKALAAHAAASSGSSAKDDSADANKPSDGAKS